MKPDFEPAYVRLLSGSELPARVTSAYRHLEDCDLCARYCRVNRRRTTKGAVCRTGERAVVHSFGPHHGEEGPLRGSRGSGTIFFSWCNLRCVFCQNWEISQKGIGREIEPDELAAMMLALQPEGCHNINLVTPSHVVAQISRETYLNLMSQYRPCYRAWDYPPLDRPITREEFDRALAAAATHGLHRLDRPTY